MYYDYVQSNPHPSSARRVRKGGWYGSKPSSSSNCSIRAFRARISQFELIELILLLKLDKQFPVEQCEATAPQSTEPSPPKHFFTLLDLCVSSLRRGHANLLGIVPILMDDPRRESIALVLLVVVLVLSLLCYLLLVSLLLLLCTYFGGTLPLLNQPKSPERFLGVI